MFGHVPSHLTTCGVAISFWWYLAKRPARSQKSIRIWEDLGDYWVFGLIRIPCQRSPWAITSLPSHSSTHSEEKSVSQESGPREWRFTQSATQDTNIHRQSEPSNVTLPVLVRARALGVAAVNWKIDPAPNRATQAIWHYADSIGILNHGARVRCANSVCPLGRQL